MPPISAMWHLMKMMPSKGSQMRSGMMLKRIAFMGALFFVIFTNSGEICGQRYEDSCWHVKCMARGVLVSFTNPGEICAHHARAHPQGQAHDLAAQHMGPRIHPAQHAPQPHP